MERLPQELVDEISRYLDHDDLKSTLTVSRKFCYAAERYSGEFRAFTLTEDNAARFLCRFSGYRFRYLREVYFTTTFPRVGDEEPYPECRENKAQLREKDEIFTKQISFLFCTLKALEDHLDKTYLPGNLELGIYAPTTEVDYDICLHHIYPSWRVHLLNPDTLPELNLIRSLDVRTGAEYSPYDRDEHAPSKLDWRVLVDLIVKLPRLERFSCKLGGDEWSPRQLEDKESTHFLRDWEGPRRDSRHGFGKAMESCFQRIPKSLRRVSMDFLWPFEVGAEEVDHRTSMPDLVSPAAYDPFSCGLRLFSSNLRQMMLKASVDQTLFWPQDTATAPAWPNLQSLEVMFHPVSPSGTWYFEGPRGEGAGMKGFSITESSYPPLETTEEDDDADEHADEQTGRRDGWGSCTKFRVKPSDNELGPFLAAFARAAANMLSLREWMIWAPLNWDPEYGSRDPDDEPEPGDGIDYDLYPDATLHLRNRDPLGWGIAYAAPNVYTGKRDPGELYSGARQIWWKVGQWRPDPLLHHLFQQIGEQKYGEALKEYWRDGEYGDELLYRYEFTDRFIALVRK
jgi:hypothetical protein